jgi:hypothetical protein
LKRRWLRHVGRGLGVVAGVAVLAGVGGVLWLRSDAGNRFLLNAALQLAAPARGSLTASHLETDLFHHLVLHDIALRGPDGGLVAGVESLDITYDLGGLFGRRVRVDGLTLTGGSVELRGDDGTCVNPIALWDLPPASGAPWSGLGVDIDVAAITVGVDRASLCAGKEPLELTGGLVTASGSVFGRTVTLTASHIEGTTAGPSWSVLPTGFGADLSGSWDGETAALGAEDKPVTVFLGAQRAELWANVRGLDRAAALEARVRNVHVEPEPLGIVGVHGPFEASGTVSGSLRAPHVELQLESPGGGAHLLGGVDLRGATPTWRADLTLPTEVQLGHTVEALRDTRVSGHVVAEGAGFRWPDDLRVVVSADVAGVVEGVGPYALRGSSPLTLDHGVVTCDAMNLGAPVGSATSALNIDVVGRHGQLRVVDADVDLSALRTYAGAALDPLQGRGRYAGTLAIDWSDGFSIVARGDLRAPRLAYGDQVRTQGIHGPVDFQWQHGAGHVAATLDVAGLEAPAGGSGLTADAGRVDVDLDVSAAGAEGNVGMRAVGVALARRPMPLLVADALLSSDRVAFAAIGGSVTGPEAPSVEPGRTPDEELLSAQGNYAFATRTLRLEEARITPVPEVDWALVEPATFSFAQERIALDATLAAGRGAGRVHASGGVRLHGDSDLDISLQGFDLATVNALVPGQALAGSVTAAGRLEGPLTVPRATLDADVAGLSVPGVATDAFVHGRWVSDGTSVAMQSELRRASGSPVLLSVAGTVPIRPDGDLVAVDAHAPLALTITLPPSGTAEWREVLDPGLLPADVPLFRTSAGVHIGGTVAAPSAEASGIARVRTASGWVSVDLDARVVDERATVRAVANQALVRRAEASGTVGLALSRVTGMLTGGRAPDLDLVSDLALDLVPLQLPLSALGTPAAINGSLLGGLHVSGDPRRPKVEGALLVINGAVGDVPVSPAMVTLTGTDSGYQVDASLAFGGGGSIRASGVVPIEARFDALGEELSRSGLNIVVEGDGVPLKAASALVPAMSNANGLATIRGVIRGQPNAPEPDLTLALAGGSFTILPLNVDYSDVVVTAHLTAKEIVLNELSAVTRSATRDLLLARPGSMRATARVALDHFSPGAVKGTLDLKDAWVANRTDYALRASSSLRVSGDWPRIALSGRVDVDDANVVLNESFFTSESSFALDPAIQVVRNGAVAVARAAGPSTPLDLDFNVEVFLNRRAAVDLTIPMEQFGGELTKSLSNLRFALNLDSPYGMVVSRSNGVIQVAGVVEPLSGVANVLGKNFDIAPGGQISFTGVDYLEPVLNLDAVLPTVGYGNITAHITGAAQSPTISFSSDQGQSLDDMISVLLFSAPVNELQDRSSAAITAAFQSIFRSQMNQATSLTSLDVLELSPENLTFGKRFGKNVLVEVVYNTNAASATKPTNPVELRVEVPLWKGWYLEGSGGTAGVGGVKAYSRWRF